MMNFNAIPALTYRLEALEKKYAALETYSKTSIENLMSEISFLKLTKSNKPTHNVVITKQQKRRLQNSKRNAKDTTQRWTAWKEQFQAGMTIPQIANEWGCTRKAVWYAKQKNFIKNASSCPDIVKYSN